MNQIVFFQFAYLLKRFLKTFSRRTLFLIIVVNCKFRYSYVIVAIRYHRVSIKIVGPLQFNKNICSLSAILALESSNSSNEIVQGTRNIITMMPKIIEFMRVPSYTNFTGNKKVESLANARLPFHLIGTSTTVTTFQKIYIDISGEL